jgi:hypothetical protein
MAVQSDKIKDVVAKVTFIESSGDKAFQTDAVRSTATQLLLVLTVGFTSSPTFAAAAIQHLTDAGYDISLVKGEAYSRFQERFGTKLSKFTDSQRDQIRQISVKLFKPYSESSSPA